MPRANIWFWLLDWRYVLGVLLHNNITKNAPLLLLPANENTSTEDFLYSLTYSLLFDIINVPIPLEFNTTVFFLNMWINQQNTQWMLFWEEIAYVTIWNPVFCLPLYLTGVHFRGELLHVADVSEQKIKCRPIRTREMGGATFSAVLCVYHNVFYKNTFLHQVWWSERHSIY